MVEKLDKISEGVCDGSTSGAKSFKEIVKAHAKHTTAGNQKDIWHRQVKVIKKWNKMIQQKGWEELKAKLPATKLYRWYYTCANTCGGDGEVFQANWLGAAQHYRVKRDLSDSSASLLYHFLILFATDINAYVHCRSTALVESFHSLSNKYVPKRIHYNYKRYCARKSLAVLDWNENVGVKHKRGKRTHKFRSEIVNTYINCCNEKVV